MKTKDLKIGQIVKLNNPELINGNGFHFVNNSNFETLSKQVKFLKLAQDHVKGQMIVNGMELIEEQIAKVLIGAVNDVSLINLPNIST